MYNKDENQSRNYFRHGKEKKSKINIKYLRDVVDFFITGSIGFNIWINFFDAFVPFGFREWG